MQMVEIVSKYINNNPDKWHLKAIALVMNALQQAFPCK
ncbi:MAG: Rap1a/Tai family immunity protein [Actinomycetota bacterium]